MSFLSNFRLLPKLLALTGLMACVAIVIAYFGTTSLRSLSNSTNVMESAGYSALLGARMNQNLLVLSRSQFRIAADPRAENASAVAKVISEQSKLFDERLAELKSVADDEIRAGIEIIEKRYADYRNKVEATMTAASAVQHFEISGEVQRVHDEAIQGRAVAEALQAQLTELSRILDTRVKNVSAAASAEYEYVSRLMMIVAAVGIALGLGLGFVIGQYGIAKPISSIVEILQKLAAGDLSIEVTGMERGDEVGDVAKTALIFKDNGLAKIRLEKEQKDAEQNAVKQRKTDMLRLADEFQNAVGGIVETVSAASSQLESAAMTLTTTAELTQQQSGIVASASEQTSVNVQGVAAASEELATTVSEIGRQVQESSSIAGEAVNQASKTNDSIVELSQSADRIGNVVGLINSIASQTNLLALNATIEAARAGDAGKGFAVVAQEVKALADQTSKATNEIAGQISSMQSATKDAVSAIQEITTTIRKMSEISGAIAAAVEEQSATTQEISRNVTEAAKGTTEVASSIIDVSKGANETGSASSQVLASAQQLNGESRTLRQQVDKFLANVRAA